MRLCLHRKISTKTFFGNSLFRRQNEFKVLRHLNDYNLNALSLFGTEESLLETLAIKVMDFRS